MPLRPPHAEELAPQGMVRREQPASHQAGAFGVTISTGQMLRDGAQRARAHDDNIGTRPQEAHEQAVVLVERFNIHCRIEIVVDGTPERGTIDPQACRSLHDHPIAARDIAALRRRPRRRLCPRSWRNLCTPSYCCSACW